MASLKYTMTKSSKEFSYAFKSLSVLFTIKKHLNFIQPADNFGDANAFENIFQKPHLHVVLYS